MGYQAPHRGAAIDRAQGGGVVASTKMRLPTLSARRTLSFTASGAMWLRRPVGPSSSALTLESRSFPCP